MGTYITADNIVDKKDQSDANIEDIIVSIEDWIHEYCNDIFYEETSYAFKFNGNSKRVFFLPGVIPYDLVSITSILQEDSNAVTSTLAADHYAFNEHSLVKRIGIWERVLRRDNYHVTCSIGNATTDRFGNANKRYKPKGIIRAVETLVIKDLDDLYGTTSGTAAIIPTPQYEFSYEKAFDYEYRRGKKGSVDSNDPTPTGIPSIDRILRSWQRPGLVLAGLDSNLNDTATFTNSLVGE